MFNHMDYHGSWKLATLVSNDNDDNDDHDDNDTCDNDDDNDPLMLVMMMEE
jgi:hypothetical protein